MKHTVLHKLISLGLITVIIMASTAGFWQDVGAEEIALAKSLKTAHAAIPSLTSIKSNPICPCNQNPDDEGLCGPCRYCACHAPLIAQPVHLACPTSQECIITFLEPFEVLPEVYLSIFIPPQNIV
jgi:hypothetical protein